ncbi:MAG: hypothetical protein AMXMBFR53_03250 [Gemmatimonadota bacterium]
MGAPRIDAPQSPPEQLRGHGFTLMSSDTQPLRVRYVGAPGTRRERVLAALPVEVTVFDAPADVGELVPGTDGVVLVDEETVSAEEVLALAEKAATVRGWCLGLARTDGGETTVRAVSVGQPATLAEFGAYAADPRAHPTVLLDLHRALIEAGRLRHALNNVLTAALAETQLLLLEDDLEERESVEAIEEQLRRFRDLLASAAHLHEAHR